MNLMNSGMWGIGFALVDMRQRKLLKRFVGTPMRRGDFLLALMSSRLVLMIIEIGLLLTLGVLVFHMKVLGSIFAILFIGGAGCDVLWRSWITYREPGTENRERKRPHESCHDAHVDFFWSVLFLRALSAVIQPLIKALPLTALNDALRASILEGTPLIHQWPRLLVMVLWGGVSFVLALRWFRWT